MKQLLFAAIALITAGAPAFALDLNLECAGVGTFPESQTGFASATNPSTGQTTYGSGTRVGTGQTQGVVQIETSGDAGRIFIPRIMVPAINSGSDGGWRPIDELVVGEHEITGRFTLNFLNKPHVSIDRRTGAIDLDGSFRFGFSGQCEAVDASENRF